MSQISTTDIAQLLQLSGRATASGISAANRVPIGQVIQAQVLQALGDGLFKLSIGNSTLTASSQAPLAPGDQLNVETSRDSAGALSLRLINQTSISNNKTTTTPPENGVMLSIKSDEGTEPSVDAVGARQAAAARLAGLIKPGGVLSQLVSQRPDLAGRIENLIRSATDRPKSLGNEIETLNRQVDQLPTFRSVTPDPKSPAETTGRLLDQLFGKNALDNPRQFAESLASRLTGLARGLEATLAKTNQTLPAVVEQVPQRNASSPPSPSPTQDVSRPATSPSTASAPTSNIPSAVRTAVAEEALQWASTLARDEQRTPSANPEITSNRTSSNLSMIEKPSPIVQGSIQTSNTKEMVTFSDDGKGMNRPAIEDAGKPSLDGSLIAKSDRGNSSVSILEGANAGSKAILQGAWDGDLKGQLLELRSQLSVSAQQQPEGAAAAQQAIQRTDMLINQVTGQQLRNLDGLNQYLHVQLPMDPKTGIQDAHLQVFYRQHGSQSEMASDENDRFTVALFLNMSKLGNVLATVTGVDGTVSVGFTVDSATTKQTFDRSIDELRSGLDEAGYDGAMITVRESAQTLAAEDPSLSPEEDLWDEFVAQTPLSDEAGARLDQEA